jgi:hypothetical protein
MVVGLFALDVVIMSMYPCQSKTSRQLDLLQQKTTIWLPKNLHILPALSGAMAQFVYLLFKSGLKIS